uniref:Methyltransferase domain-containing protein n=2 Tax=Parascaris univalens TaxID=6257 RepID=A0A914ZL82_PARUN
MERVRADYGFSVEELADLVRFVQSYNYLHEYTNVRFFADQIWKKIPSDWLRYLSTLSNAELNAFPFDEPSPECPESLRRFLIDSHRCNLLSNYVERYGYDVLWNSIVEKSEMKMNIRIGAKKQHEINRLALLITDYCRIYRVKRIVDVGCGIGHLLNLLSPMFDVVGVECDQLLCNAGKKRYPSLKYENLTLKTADVDRERVLNILCGQKGERSAIVSLHGCGDLQPDLLQWFTKLPKHRVPLLFTVGCCYHKMSCAGKPVMEWALSNALRSVCRNNWVLHKSALRLACQGQLSRWPSSKEERDAHCACFLRRALLECVYERSGINAVKRFPRHLNRSFRELQSVGIEIAERLKLDGEERAKMIREYRNTYLDHQYLFDTVEPFTMLQALMQMPLESLILTDRYLYLMESGCATYVLPLFDSKISPRNFCLVGCHTD